MVRDEQLHHAAAILASWAIAFALSFPVEQVSCRKRGCRVALRYPLRKAAGANGSNRLSEAQSFGI